MPAAAQLTPQRKELHDACLCAVLCVVACTSFGRWVTRGDVWGVLWGSGRIGCAVRCAVCGAGASRDRNSCRNSSSLTVCERVTLPTQNSR